MPFACVTTHDVAGHCPGSEHQRALLGCGQRALLCSRCGMGQWPPWQMQRCTSAGSAVPVRWRQALASAAAAHPGAGIVEALAHASGAVSPPGTKGLAQAQGREEGTSVPMRTMQLNV
jgi:hypothetical protein